jgi:23S rRNA pseudouridine2605 synthase
VLASTWSQTSVPARLNQFLASAGLGSRRAVETLIRDGRVTVNGRPGELGDRVDESDRVEVDGRPVGVEQPVYLLLHKPAGVITTAADTHGRQTVLDLVEPGVRVFPVGRLDRDTTGALLLTNDGQLANALMHPSGGVPKTYQARVAGAVGEAELRALEQGVQLEDGLTAPATARTVGPSVVELTIHEGRNRQVRRMLEAVGHPVIALHRSFYAGIGVEDLGPGAWRALRPDEVAVLRAAADG